MGEEEVVGVSDEPEIAPFDPPIPKIVPYNTWQMEMRYMRQLTLNAHLGYEHYKRLLKTFLFGCEIAAH